MHDVGWAWWLLRSVGMVAFRGLAIYGVVWLTRRVSSAGRAERGAARTDGLPAGGPQAPTRRR